MNGKLPVIAAKLIIAVGQAAFVPHDKVGLYRRGIDGLFGQLLRSVQVGKKLIDAGIEWVKQYSWKKTAEETLAYLETIRGYL